MPSRRAMKVLCGLVDGRDVLSEAAHVAIDEWLADCKTEVRSLGERAFLESQAHGRGALTVSDTVSLAIALKTSVPDLCDFIQQRAAEVLRAVYAFSTMEVTTYKGVTGQYIGFHRRHS